MRVYANIRSGLTLICGISTVAVRLLPKQETRVRFSYPAPRFDFQVFQIFRGWWTELSNLLVKLLEV